METILNSSAATDAARRIATDAQKMGSEFKSDFDRAVNRSQDAAKDMGDKMRGAAGDAAASGRDIAQDYLERGKRRVSQTADLVTKYADDNTAIVAICALGVGALIGYLASRR